MTNANPFRELLGFLAGVLIVMTPGAAGQDAVWQQFAAIRRGQAVVDQPAATVPTPDQPAGTAELPAPPTEMVQAPDQPARTVSALAQATADAALSQPIVYTRVPRTRGVFEVSLRDGSRYTLESPDVWDALPDTRRVFSGFNGPGQLVLRQPDGVERVLYDCFNSPEPCVPLDPMVSFDGSRVLFSVYRGRRLVSSESNGITMPNQLLGGAKEAQMHVVAIDTGAVTPLAHSPGDHDISPVWLPDGRILFASTRGGTEEPFLNFITPNNRDGEPQLYISEADGSNAFPISPHEVTAAMHPYVLKSGRIAYSSQWLSHNLAYLQTNGSINWPGTLDNMWVIMDMDRRGGDMTALLGAHKNSLSAANGRTKTMKALHFLGQRQNEDICAVNYYRANNLGLGDVFCWTPEPVGVEGALPGFLPRNLYNVANWSKSNDEVSFDEDGIFLGKIGYPEGLENNQLLLTVGWGACLWQDGNLQSFQRAMARQPNKRACDVGLYATTRIPSTEMSDLALIVDQEEWHEFGARVVAAREVATPPLGYTADGSCQLASSDAGTAETSPSRPYQFNNNYRVSANNGGEIDGLPHAELAAIRFWEVVPHTSRRATFKNSIGHQLRLLGDVPLLEDDSFKVALPCDMPYLMAGLDAQGRVIKRDQIPQSLRPGEKRVCTGCHLHSRPGRPYEDSLAFQVPALPLLRSRPVPTYEQDIQPIFQARCQQCHGDGDVPLMNYGQLVWDFMQNSIPESRRVQVSESGDSRRRYGLQRPYTSKYVNTMFARESLLYWKAANERTDGRTDSTYADDIDFGPDHPTSITAAELRTLAAWLDSGATSNRED